MEFIIKLNESLQNINSNNDQHKTNAIQFLRNTAFESNVDFNHRLTALEALLNTFSFDELKPQIDALLEETIDPHQASLLNVTLEKHNKDYQDSDDTVDSFRNSWCSCPTFDNVNAFKRFLTTENHTLLDKITIISTVLNNCYQDNQKDKLSAMVNDIYTFLQNTTISHAITRDILTSLFKIRNPNFQNANMKSFTEHLAVWINSLDTFLLGPSTRVYCIHKAWIWITEALEFAKPNIKESLLSHLVTWITENPFNPELPTRERCKYQFFACEYLLQSYQPDKQEIATQFLMNIALSDQYSTFIRGDALDVLLRGDVPPNHRDTVNAIRMQLATVREDTRINLQLQAQELRREAPGEHQPAFGVTQVPKTTFDDAQNIHATEINDAIAESILNMLKDPETVGNTIYKVIGDIEQLIWTLDTTENITAGSRISADHRSRAEYALQRYIEDPAVFTEKHVKLGGVLVLVWNRIIRHVEHEELYYRLIEELSEAFNTCATGHLSRVVSVLVGYYPDIKQFSGFETQLKDNIKAYLATAIKKVDDDELRGDLLVAMIDSNDNSTYINFAAKLQESARNDLCGEFVPEYLSAESFDKIFDKEWPKSQATD